MQETGIAAKENAAFGGRSLKNGAYQDRYTPLSYHVSCATSSYVGITQIRFKGRSWITSSQPAPQAPLKNMYFFPPGLTGLYVEIISCLSYFVKFYDLPVFPAFFLIPRQSVTVRTGQNDRQLQFCPDVFRCYCNYALLERTSSSYFITSLNQSPLTGTLFFSQK